MVGLLKILKFPMSPEQLTGLVLSLKVIEILATLSTYIHLSH